MSTGIIPDPALQDITFWAPAGSCESLHMLRLDAIDPVVSGNKWFKLRYNLEAVEAAGCSGVLTFGGAYSNHLVATAAAASRFGFQSIGIVRGEDAARNPSATLRQCAAYGMRLHFVSRGEYAGQTVGATCQSLVAKEKLFLIPEGGDNAEGRKGAGVIVRYIPAEATHLCLAVGSGTTMAGMLDASPPGQTIGFPALNDDSLLQRISDTRAGGRWSLKMDYTFGGFARTAPVLISFMQDFFQRTGIPTDIVYTGKMMFGIADMLQRRQFPADARIVCIHTGGLQGNPEGTFG